MRPSIRLWRWIRARRRRRALDRLTPEQRRALMQAHLAAHEALVRDYGPEPFSDRHARHVALHAALNDAWRKRRLR